MKNIRLKHIIVISVVFMSTSATTPMVCSGIRTDENVMLDGWKTVSLRGECHSISFGGILHLGQLWFCPFDYMGYQIFDDLELKINGEPQSIDFNYSVRIELHTFFGIAPTLFSFIVRGIKDIEVYGLCKDVVITCVDLPPTIYETQTLFDITDIEELGQTTWGLTSADFDTDGLLDFAVSSATVPFSEGEAKISMYKNENNDQFTRRDVYHFNYSYIDDLDSGDYDNDGDIDLLYTHSERVWYNNLPIKINGTGKILFNNGDNTFTREYKVFWHGPGDPENREQNRINPQITSADYDLDGDIDFLVGDNSGMVEFYRNDGSGVFSSSGILYDFGYLSWGLTSGDFDNDGDIDVLIAAATGPNSQKGYIYLKKNQMMETTMKVCFDQGPGEIIASTSSIRGTACLQSLDYDNDGDCDFLAGVDHNIYLCNNTNGIFDSYYLGYLPLSDQFYVDYLDKGGMTSGDFNSDGYDDFITGGVQGRVRLFVTNISQLPLPQSSLSNNKQILEKSNKDHVLTIQAKSDPIHCTQMNQFYSGIDIFKTSYLTFNQ
ncbi:MAG: VCBS repeat-containing protein [Candidatus Thermoplasmatota archaeon]|nr:VCBS repeat-containing protein [Candidatus Thermoplasmatota archaeon]